MLVKWKKCQHNKESHLCLFIYLFWRVLNDCHVQLWGECAIFSCQWLLIHHGARTVQRSSPTSVFKLVNVETQLDLLYLITLYLVTVEWCYLNPLFCCYWMIKYILLIVHVTFCSVWKSWYWLEVEVYFKFCVKFFSKLTLQSVEDSEHRNTMKSQCKVSLADSRFDF
jgi:hypothetical protein